MKAERNTDPSLTDKNSLAGIEVPADRTGPTPEEIAYKPHIEVRYLPRYTFTVVLLLLLLAFIGGGAWYYHSTILPEKNYLTANRLFRNGEYEEALRLYKKVLKTRPERRDTLFQIGFILEKQRDIPGAQAAYTAHLKNQPSDAIALMQLGNLYKEMGSPDKALVFLQRAAKKKTKNAGLFFDIASLSQQLSRDEQAVEYFKKTITLEAKDVDQLIVASKSLMTLKHYQEALTGYEKATRIASEDKRGAHGSYAAKRMLGLPTSEKELIAPKVSMGLVRLGMSPEERESLGEGKLDGATVHVNEEGKIVQISGTAPFLRTKEGLGISNFDLPKYAHHFERWEKQREGHAPLALYRFKAGGLSFLLDASAEKPRAILVHMDKFPLDTGEGDWTRADE